MFQTVELPVWALILMGLLAAITAASHLLFPSVRWFFRRRAERVVARLNMRLKRPIQPFKLARRNDMIQNVLYDPQVIEAVNQRPRRMARRRTWRFETAQRYAREIVPSFSATLYFAVGIRVAKWIARTMYRVRVVNSNSDAMDAIDPEATVVFIINHRSNMDYVLVTYLAAEDAALSYAVGEWARVWPLTPLIKMMGGYFIRRKSLNPLYRKVLARYVQLSTREGVTQAVFLEGGLSRTGALMPPKLGLISYILDGFDAHNGRDVVFVPVGLNYDRVIEDRVLVGEAGRGGKPFRFRLSMVFRYAARHVWQRITGRFVRLGFAAVAFGKPVSLRKFLAENPADPAKDLADQLMFHIARAIPVLPVPLVAQILLEADGRLNLKDLTERFALNVADLRAQGAEMCLPQAGESMAIKSALSILEARKLVEVTPTQVTLRDSERLVAFYAASIEDIVAT